MGGWYMLLIEWNYCYKENMIKFNKKKMFFVFQPASPGYDPNPLPFSVVIRLTSFTFTAIFLALIS